MIPKYLFLAVYVDKHDSRGHVLKSIEPFVFQILGLDELLNEQVDPSILNLDLNQVDAESHYYDEVLRQSEVTKVLDYPDNHVNPRNSAH